HPAWVPTFLLARCARTHVKTVLVGEGADELFAGYPTYLGGALAARYARLPAGVRRALAAAAPALGAPQGNTTVRYLLRRFLEEADLPAPARHRAWTGCVDAAHLAALATPGGPLARPPEPVALPARAAGPPLPFARATLARLDPRVTRPGAVRALLDEHVPRRRDNRRELGALVVLQLWREAAGVA